MKKPFIIILVFFFAVSCDFDDSDKIMDEKTYENVFIELAFLDQYDEKLLNDITRDELRDTIFDHYGVTKEQFRISHEHYQSQVEKQLERIDRIGQRIRDERDKVNEADRKYKESLREKSDSLKRDSLNQDERNR